MKRRSDTQYDGIEVASDWFLPIVQSIETTGIDPASWLPTYGLANLYQAWHPLRDWLRLLRAIRAENTRSLSLFKIGLHVPECIFPIGSCGLEATLRSYAEFYTACHRGGEVGGYQIQASASNQLCILTTTPYPDEFEYGVLWGCARRCSSKCTPFTVKRAGTLSHNDSRVYQLESCPTA